MTTNRQIAGSVKWSYIGTTLQRVCEPVLTIYLATLLTPDDFGVMAIAVSVMAFARQLQAMGLGRALIQAEEELPDVCDAVFWINVALGAFIFAILQATATFAGQIFQDPRVVSVLRVTAFAILILSLDCVQDAILRRNFQFKKLAIRRIIPLGVQALVSIALARMGFSYWALIWGTLARNVTAVLCLWAISPWRPRFSINWRVARRCLRFGGLVTLGTLQGWLLMGGDRLFAGRAFSSEMLGAYDFGANVVNLALIGLCEPVFSVSFAAFSRAQGDIELLRRTYAAFVHGLSALVLPVAVGMAVCAGVIIPWAFEGKWDAAIPVITIFAISPGIPRILNLNTGLYQATGRPDIQPRVNLLQLVYVVPAYIIGGKYGLLGFTLARASVGVVFWLPHVWLAWRVLGKPRRFFWGEFLRPAAAAGTMATAVLTVDRHVIVLAPLLRITAMVITGVVTYLLAIALVDRPLARKALHVALANIPSRRARTVRAGKGTA